MSQQRGDTPTMAAAAAVMAQINVMPLPLLLAVGVAMILASVLVSSLLFRTLLKPKNAPPYISCTPLVGGVRKFISVSPQPTTRVLCSCLSLGAPSH